jgi:hypothetical protein
LQRVPFTLPLMRLRKSVHALPNIMDKQILGLSVKTWIVIGLAIVFLPGLVAKYRNRNTAAASA